MGSPHDYLERCDKLAIMGGTFDPIHLGHLAVAETVLHKFEPNRVLFVPSGQPPHKQGQNQTLSEHRYNMVLKSICHNPGFDISRIEINRHGESYTIDTIKELKEICPPNAEILFIIGADALLEILTWREIKELLQLCKFIAIPRPGTDNEKLDTHIKLLQNEYKAEIHLLDMPPMDISGTSIRSRFANGETVSGLMPKNAEDYARNNGLYELLMPDLGKNHFEWAKARLKLRLSARRFKHTLGVVEEAEKLAKHYGESVKKARWAALLHDCAKEYSSDKKRMLCHLWGIHLDPVLEAEIDITHSLLGAECAEHDYYVKDPEIKQAIRYHTTGNKGMTMLDKIVTLADYIEPYREDYYPLTEIRKHAYTNINKALAIGTKATIESETIKGNPIHEWSNNALKDFKKKS